MKEGVVEEVKAKDTKGGKCFVLTINGQKASFFADSEVEIGDIEKGDKIEYKTEQNGEYTNITELGLLQKNTGQSADSNSRGNVEMVALNATKAMAEIRSGQKFDPDEFIECRDRLARSTVELIQELKEEGE